MNLNPPSFFTQLAYGLMRLAVTLNVNRYNGDH